MAIEAKVAFMNDVERALSDELTMRQVSTVMSIMLDRLSNYSVESAPLTGEQPDDFLDSYLRTLSVEGKSPKTIERYGYIIRRMQRAVAVPTRNITVFHLRRYLSDEKARGISDVTLESTRQVFSAFFNWLHRERLIDNNPCANLGAIKCPKKQKDLYSDTDIERMKFGCQTIRDRAIVCFLKATGCRISEMTQLNRDDIDFNNMECTVLGKGNKERVVFLDQVAVMTLQNYLDTRTDDLPALFIGKGTSRMTPHGIRKMLTNLGRRSNVNHVHPHKFRRTLATNLIRHGAGLPEVASILGHDKIDTTMKYVVLDKTDVKNSYRKYA